MIGNVAKIIIDQTVMAPIVNTTFFMSMNLMVSLFDKPIHPFSISKPSNPRYPRVCVPFLLIIIIHVPRSKETRCKMA